MPRHRGWRDGEQNCNFDEAWDFACDIYFEYNGREYRIDLEDDASAKAYDVEDNYKVLRHYESKEDFYSSTLFGKPIQEVIDNSMLIFING